VYCGVFVLETPYAALLHFLVRSHIELGKILAAEEDVEPESQYAQRDKYESDQKDFHGKDFSVKLKYELVAYGLVVVDLGNYAREHLGH